MAVRVGLAACFLVTLAAVLPASSGETDETAPAQAASPRPEATSEPEPSDREATATCPAGPITIRFVQAEELRIEGESGKLASASYTDRALSKACRPTSPPRSARYDGLGPGIYRDVTLTCDPDGPVTIHVGPVLDGDNDMAVIGSNVAVYAPVDGQTATIASAVMKNREHASVASRIYAARSVCREA